MITMVRDFQWKPKELQNVKPFIGNFLMRMTTELTSYSKIASSTT